MKASSPLLRVIAKDAGVRPPHVHFVFHLMREMRDAFDVDACSTLAQLEARHVVAIVDAMTERGVVPSKASTGTTAKPQTTRLPDGFQAPADWLLYAREKRLWTSADVADEFEAFTSWTRAKGARYVDWLAAWQGHVRRSNRPNGTHSPHAEPTDRVDTLRRQISTYERLGRHGEALEARRELDKLVGNVVPFQRIG